MGLDELVNEYNIVFPDYDEFLKLAEEETLEKLIIEFIKQKPRSLKELISILKYDKKEIKQIIENLIQQKKISKSNKKFHIL